MQYHYAFQEVKQHFSKFYKKDIDMQSQRNHIGAQTPGPKPNLIPNTRASIISLRPIAQTSIIPEYIKTVKKCRPVLKIPETGLNKWVEEGRESLDRIGGAEKQLFNGTTDCRSRLLKVAREEEVCYTEASGVKNEREDVLIISEEKAG